MGLNLPAHRSDNEVDPASPPLNFAKAAYFAEVLRRLNRLICGVMYYAYILKSKKQAGAIYIGYTSDLKKRLPEHNDPMYKSYSKRFAPWEIESYFAFTTEQQAKNFEVYLKGNSGKAFMRKRLISETFKKALKKFNNGR